MERSHILILLACIICLHLCMRKLDALMIMLHSLLSKYSCKNFNSITAVMWGFPKFTTVDSTTSPQKRTISIHISNSQLHIQAYKTMIAHINYTKIPIQILLSSNSSKMLLYLSLIGTLQANFGNKFSEIEEQH